MGQHRKKAEKKTRDQAAGELKMSTEAHAQVHRTVEPRWLRFHGAWRGAAGSSRRSRAREVKTSVKFSADSSSAPWTGSTDKGPEREDRPRVRGEERHQRRGKGTVNPPARSTHHGNARARATWHPPRGRGFRFLARAAAVERNDEPAGRRECSAFRGSFSGGPWLPCAWTDGLQVGRVRSWSMEEVPSVV
jgi:hypothetical protein